MKWLLLLFLPVTCLQAQLPGVPIYPEGRGARPQAGLLAAARELYEAKALLAMDTLLEQSKRTSCELVLPAPETKELSGRERWQRARASHVRVGYYYQCTQCDKWHLDLAGGYAITADGAVATCAHVISPPDEMKEGYLITATDEDVVMPVLEVLAVNAGKDCAILRVKAEKLTPLPLATEGSPGDAVWCFSDPSGKRGYYSEGIVSRFVQRPFLRKKEQTEGGDVPKPLWLETTLDWAPGSSGSALVDSYGNCVGHVSEIEAVTEDPPTRARGKGAATTTALGTYIVFHHAIAAVEVKSLIKTK